MHSLSTESEIKKAQIRNEKSSGSGVCGFVSPFVSSASEPCKPVLRGGYCSPQNNHSVGDKVVVLDFGNSEQHKFEVPFDSCIDRRGLDVICKKKRKRTRSFSISSSHHEASDAMNHGGVTGSYIDIEGGSSQLDLEFVSTLIRLLDEHNELVRLFRTDQDRVESDDVPEFRIRLFSVVGAREYDLPTSGTLGANVFENGPSTRTDYDVIMESRGGFPQRVNKLYPSYMSLQFPLLFVYGNPQYFVTFMCNVNWQEIKRYMLQFLKLTLADIADIVVRVFEQKVQDFCKFLKDRQLFGSVTRLLYTVEFQKHGLDLHCQSLVGDRTDKIAAKIVRKVGDPPADTNNRSIQIDEIQNYIDGRFVCPHEACPITSEITSLLQLIVIDEGPKIEDNVTGVILKAGGGASEEMQV
ncbi:DNA helicase [Tanacetum coccineum]